MIKKILYSILFVLLVSGGLFTEAEANSPNVKDCLENEADCSDDPANDEEGDELLQGESVSTGSLILDIGKMILALFLVLALIYALLKFLNKKNNLQNQQSLQNLGGISVGQNKSIQVIKVGTAYFLVGVGDNVELLHEITDQALIDSLLDESSDPEKSQLNDFLAKFMSKKTKQKDESEQSSDEQFKNLFSKELDELKENRQQLLKQQTKRKDSHE